MGGGRLDPSTAFGELCKLIFIKIIDEKQPRKTGDAYEFQIKTHETAEELAERIHYLYGRQRNKKGNEEVLTERIKIKPAVIMTLVSHLESINLSQTDIDVKGFAFEKFMDGFFKGSYGQYFTPRELIKFIVDMMNPSRESLIIDPACGSGGFLLHVFDTIRLQAGEYADKGTAEHSNYWADFARNNLFGLEINENIAQVAKMNMIIHGDGHTNVACADSLQPFDDLKSLTRNDSFDKEKFDYVLTNPPFGSNISSTEYPFISQYELGKSTTKAGKTVAKKNQKSEVLFIERCLDFLKKGTGKMAIILPDGVLSNSSMQYVRDFLMEKTQILAIISFPQLAFKQYGAGVKSSVIFCRKKADFEGEINYKIFMAIAENVGYDSTGRKTKENDLDIILEEYRKQHGQG